MRRIFSITSGGLMMTGVALALLFTFLIAALGFEGGVEQEKVNIFYYFGEYYKELKELDAATAGMTAWFADTIHTQEVLIGVFGTVISACTLLSVVAFATVATVKYICSWVSKKEDKSYVWALACVLSYLVGAALFVGYHSVASTMTASGQEEELLTKASGGTVAGVILCSIFLLLGLATRVVSLGKEPWRKANLGKVVCSLVGVVFVGVLLILLEKVQFGAILQIDVMGGKETLERISWDMKGGFLWMNDLLSGLLGEMFTDRATKGYAELTTALSKVNAYNLVSQILAVAFAVLAVFAACSQARGAEGKKGSGLAWSISLAVLAVGLLVLQILAWSAVADVADYGIRGSGLPEQLPTSSTLEYKTKGMFGASICCVVFSLLLLAASITRTVFARRGQRAEVQA